MKQIPRGIIFILWASLAFATTTPAVFNVTAYGASPASSDNSTAIANAETDAAVSGGIVFFPPGVYQICGATQLVLDSGVVWQGSGPGSAVIKACSSLSTTAIMLETANWNTTNCQPWLASGGSSSQYTNCPYDFGIVGMTFDGNVTGRGVAPSTSCLSTPSATHVCADVAFRGNRFLVYNSEFINSTWDGFYREMVGGVTGSPYLGYGSTTFNLGNAGQLTNVKLASNANDGELAYGPPDTKEDNSIAFWNGCAGNQLTSQTCASASGATNYGQNFSCLPASSGSVCSFNNYLSNAHDWHNYSCGIEVETAVQGHNWQAESNGVANGCGVHVAVGTPASGNSFGIIQITGIQLWLEVGPGAALQIDSPTSAYAGAMTPGNVITGLTAFDNSNGPAILINGGAAAYTHINQVSSTNNLSGNIAPLQAGVLIPGCSQDYGHVPIQGNSPTPVNIFSCTIPAIYAQPGHLLEIMAAWGHSMGSAPVAYAYSWCGLQIPTVTWFSATSGGFSQRSRLKFISGTTAELYAETAISQNTLTLVSGSTYYATGPFTATTNTDCPLAVSFNVSSSDYVRPMMFEVWAY